MIYVYLRLTRLNEMQWWRTGVYANKYTFAYPERQIRVGWLSSLTTTCNTPLAYMIRILYLPAAYI